MDPNLPTIPETHRPGTCGPLDLPPPEFTSSWWHIPLNKTFESVSQDWYQVNLRKTHYMVISCYFNMALNMVGNVCV